MGTIGKSSGYYLDEEHTQWSNFASRNPDMFKAIMLTSAGLSGGISSTIAGGNFWAGVRQGIITAGLNHLGIYLATPKEGNNENMQQQQNEPWDTNGDGILQKVEADYWGVTGKGQAITVDNSKIDWTGLEIPEGMHNKDQFNMGTTEAFIKLPWETASTYGGTSFIVENLQKNQVRVLDQRYHYDMRPNNSIENFIRNRATEIGYPSTMELYKGSFVPYMIHYKNPIITIRK